MNDLLEFIIAHFAFLYDEFGCRFVDSRTDGFNAMLVFESGNLRLRFVRDRGQIFADFQNNRRRNGRWYSFGVVRQLITGEVGGSEEMNENSAQQIRRHFSEMKALFDDVKTKETEKTLASFEVERGERLFGK